MAWPTWGTIAVMGLAWSSPLASQMYTGTFLLKGSNGATIALTLREDRTGKTTGTLAGNGITFQLSGQRHGQEISGRAAGSGTQAFFTARFQGHQLHFMLAQLGPDGRPNLRTAQQLVFTRSMNGVSFLARRPVLRPPTPV